MADGVTMNVQGIKEIREMFKQMPKQVTQDSIWAKFWRFNTKPLVKAAQQEAPIADKDIPYPNQGMKATLRNRDIAKEDGGLFIKRGTLKKSIGFFRTKASKNYMGGYVGPRVKGAFKGPRGGYFGAWVEYGSEVMHYGKFRGKDNPFMKRAWSRAHKQVLTNGFKDATTIFFRAMKTYEKRMTKYGALGYHAR
tara:strand:- start:51 stop:632 length:582 start_codon:yes stop_codon:yes gene_type:complete